MVELPTESGPVRVVEGDCLDVLRSLPDECVDAVVTDPPYGLEFMGKEWDRGVPGVPFWSAVLRVLRPGGYLLSMGGTRTYHRLACAVEDAGFEIRDCLMWIFATGFPKGQGCLKPAYEPIILARKPGPRVLPLGIDGCRVPADKPVQKAAGNVGGYGSARSGVYESGTGRRYTSAGRYPANVLHDGSGEVLEAFAAFGERTTNATGAGGVVTRGRANVYGEFSGNCSPRVYGSDTGTAARFFYCAKASKAERGAGNGHPTVKPLALMRWLVRLVTPPGGCVLDPFAGSGSTLVAAVEQGFRAVGIEQHDPYAEIARRRVAEAMGTGLLAGIV